MDIKDVKAIVVGGASGMAFATVELLKNRDADVAILDLPTSAGKEVSDRLGTRYYACDVTDYEGTEAALRKAAGDLSGLNVVCTTAGGGSEAMRTLTKDGPHSLELFQKTVDLNLIATFNICRIAAELMSMNVVEEGGERGVIINTSSIAAFEGQIGQIAYTAAKSGIAGMTLTMARDLGSLGIRVMCIAPSLFATGVTKGIPPEFEQRLTKDAAYPKRMGRPEEFANMVQCIIENPMLNGSTIRLDGGIRFAPK